MSRSLLKLAEARCSPVCLLAKLATRRLAPAGVLSVWVGAGKPLPAENPWRPLDPRGRPAQRHLCIASAFHILRDLAQRAIHEFVRDRRQIWAR
jgi:hypothetical protein